MKYNTGEKPGKGQYRCTKCFKIIILENDTDALPACPRCHNTKFKKKIER